MSNNFQLNKQKIQELRNLKLAYELVSSDSVLSIEQVSRYRAIKELVELVEEEPEKDNGEKTDENH